MGLYRELILPFLMDHFMASGRMERQRKGALSFVQGDVLEIGFGTGKSLEHYPAGVSRLVALDPSWGMLGSARSKAPPGGFGLLLVRGLAEELPFGAGSFDSVVSLWSLCTLADPQRAMQEVRRVLRPEGRFYFLEHGLAWDERARRLQRLFCPLSRLLAGGCNLNRDIEEIVSQGGLRIEKLDRYILPEAPRPLAFAAYIYRGVACRGA